MSRSDADRPARFAVLLPVAVAFLTAAVFASTLGFGFIWEDQYNLVDNPHYRGLGATQLRWMLMPAWNDDDPGRRSLWIPVTWASFGLDYVLWGMNAAGYHLTNVVLHAANAAVFYRIARILLAHAIPDATPAMLRYGAAIAALFFGVHPLRAESVAWITERRDVLSGLFFLVTVLGALEAARATGRARPRWRACSIGAYALAVASKATVVPLPLALLVLDAYPLRRLHGAWRARLVEKLPYVALATVSVWLTIYSSRLAATFDMAPLLGHERIAVAFWALARYLRTTVLPVGLSPIYEAPLRVDVWSAPYVASAAVVIAVTLALVALRRRWPAGLGAWVMYLVVIAPTTGIVPLGPHLGADHYTYLPSTSLSLLLGGAVVAVLRAGAAGRIAPRYVRLAVCGILAWLAALGLLAHLQSSIWRDHETLWRWSVDLDPECARCHGNLGEALRLQGRLEPAITHLREAVVRRPELTIFRRTLGFTLVHAGRPAEAVDVLRGVVELLPRDIDVRNFMGLALTRAGRPDQATGHFRAGIYLAPERTDLLVNLGASLATLGRVDDARQYAERALTLNPREVQARQLLDALDAAARR